MFLYFFCAGLLSGAEAQHVAETIGLNANRDLSHLDHFYLMNSKERLYLRKWYNGTMNLTKTEEVVNDTLYLIMRRAIRLVGGTEDDFDGWNTALLYPSIEMAKRLVDDGKHLQGISHDAPET